MQVFNATSQQDEDVTWSVDSNNEIVATFADGHFIKFPAGITQADLTAACEALKEASQNQEVVTPEMEAEQQAQAEASQNLVDSLNATSEDANTNADPNPAS